jgi:hypothetical protein
MTKDELLDAYEKLSSAVNAAAGCVMFAPDSLKIKDGPGLLEKVQHAAFEFDIAIQKYLDDKE